MPYDPYAPANPWWQQQQQRQQQQGQQQFAQPLPPEQRKPWWQGLPPVKSGQSPNQITPGLLQMLMLGGNPTGGASVQQGPWANRDPRTVPGHTYTGGPVYGGEVLGIGPGGAAPKAGYGPPPGPALGMSPSAWLGSMFGGGTGGAR